MDLNNIFRNLEDLEAIKGISLQTPEEIAHYLKNLKDQEIIKDYMTFYGREVKFIKRSKLIIIYLMKLTLLIMVWKSIIRSLIK